MWVILQWYVKLYFKLYLLQHAFVYASIAYTWVGPCVILRIHLEGIILFDLLQGYSIWKWSQMFGPLQNLDWPLRFGRSAFRDPHLPFWVKAKNIVSPGFFARKRRRTYLEKQHHKKKSRGKWKSNWFWTRLAMFEYVLVWNLLQDAAHRESL